MYIEILSAMTVYFSKILPSLNCLQFLVHNLYHEASCMPDLTKSNYLNPNTFLYLSI